MSIEQVPDGISTEDWATTPESVRVLVAVLFETIEQLQRRIAQLEERLNQNSSNSSMPPSSDPPGKPARPKGQASGRKRGGQPGHPGRTRMLKPVEQVDRLIDLRPVQCCGCGALLLGEDPAAQRHQVTELPRIEPVVIEYRRHTLSCLACGTETAAAWPADKPVGGFGPSVQAMGGYLTGRMGISQRDVEEAAAGAKQLLGETVTGIVGSDRWSAYNWLDAELRQLCWSHLQRDFQKLVDRQGESAQIGQDLLTQSEQLFILRSPPCASSSAMSWTTSLLPVLPPSIDNYLLHSYLGRRPPERLH